MSSRKRAYYRSEYVSGNTARRLEAVPERRPGRQPDVRRRKNPQQKALAMEGPHVAFLAVVTVVCLLICVSYLGLQASISETRNNISDYKKQISTIQSQNDALNYSINSYVNVKHIYNVAQNKLGMAQATDDQVVMYESSDSGYTFQYGDIPTK